MFKNYFKIGIRNILKYRAFSFINIFGLAVAMSISMLIMLMLADQKQTDQFHEKKERIYRVIGHTNDSALPYASTAVPLAGKLKSETPSIEQITHLTKGVGGDVTYGKESQEMRGFFADPEFFNVFSFKLHQGNIQTALQAPQSMVITSSLADRLFKSESPLGKIVRFSDRNLDLLSTDSNDNPPIDWGLFTITGVITDKGYKSHLKFDVLVSESSTKALHLEKKRADLTDNWTNYYNCYTYAVLKQESSEADLASSLNRIVESEYANEAEEIGFSLDIQKLGDISPGPFMAIPISLRMPVETYYVLAILAIVIMLLACLNYINLSIARALTRAKEIGIRKVNGGTRQNLIFQFFTESLITSLFSLVMALCLLFFIKSGFMNLWVNKYINFDLQITSDVFLYFLAFTLIVALVIGSYPALYMSKFDPLAILKSNVGTKRKKLGWRKVLSISQFTVSMFFIVTSLVIYNQLEHFLEFEYGFQTENIVNVPLQSNDYQIMATELSANQGVSEISACSFIPGSGGGNGQFLRTSGSEADYLLLTIMSVTENYVDNLGIQVVAGRNVQEAKSGAQSVVINEFAANQLGYESAAEAIGEVLEFKNEQASLAIVGVIENFQFKSLFEEGEDTPLMLRNQSENLRHLNIKVAGENPAKTLEGLEEKWNVIDPIHGFKYEFFDEQLAAMNSFFKDVVTIVGFITFLAILISSLGLLGMSIYTTERRTKEIGVRKVLGAGLQSIVFLISKEFLLLLTISIALAAPLSYFANRLWLDGLANRVDFGVGVVALGSLILLAMGLFTISSQTIRAAQKNPVESLKDE